MSSLYALTSEYMQVLELATDPDVDEDIINDTLEGLQGEIEEKLDSCTVIEKNLEAEASMYEAEIKRLTKKKKAVEANKDRIKKYKQDSMQALGIKKLKTNLFSYNIQKNPASCDIPDESKVPEEFLKPQPPKVDKAGILKRLKAGEKFEFAELVQTESIRTR